MLLSVSISMPLRFPAAALCPQCSARQVARAGLGRFDGESLTPSEQRFGGSYEGDAEGGERSSTEMSHVDYNDAHFWKLRPPSLRASEPTSMWQFSFLFVLKRRFSTSLFGQGSLYR